jgi:hypothetical protein
MSFLGFASDMPLQTMSNRPVAVSDCVWQTRLQRRGSPLQDCVEYRLLCLLTPSVPAVAIVMHRHGRHAQLVKEFRRRDVAAQGHLVQVTLTLASWVPGLSDPFLRVTPTRERGWERELVCPGSCWRPAGPEERPDSPQVFLSSGVEILTGELIEVASLGSSIEFGMLLVDLEDVKGLRAGRWRLRGTVADRCSTWPILATGARVQHMIVGPDGRPALAQ